MVSLLRDKDGNLSMMYRELIKARLGSLYGDYRLALEDAIAEAQAQCPDIARERRGLIDALVADPQGDSLPVEWWRSQHWISTRRVRSRCDEDEYQAFAAALRALSIE